MAKEPPERGDIRRIGRYTILSEIGRGAMGAVYRAHDPNIDRQVALKVIRPGALSEDEERELHRRFFAEARSGGRLRHPGVVAVYDADRDAVSGVAFLAMELVEGCSLRDILEEVVILPLPATSAIVCQVAAALDAAHREGLVHRDIKPENLLIEPSGSVKLSDFGISRHMDADLTATGQVLGTPAYMAPEQLLGHHLDARTDLFALGAVIYRCLTGVTPFFADTLAGLTYKIVHVDPRPPQLHNPELTDETSAVVQRCLAKAPEDRYQTGQELASALEETAPADQKALEQVVRQVLERQEEMSGDDLAISVPSGSAIGGLRRISQVATRQMVGSWRHRPASLLALLLVVLILAISGLLVWPGNGIDPVFIPVAQQGVLEPSGASSAGEQAPLPESELELRFENRLSSSILSVWVDDDVVFSENLRGARNIFRRMRGTAVVRRIPVPAGEHTVEVSFQGISMKVRARASVHGVFEEGSTRALRVSLNPYTDKLRLNWE